MAALSERHAATQARLSPYISLYLPISPLYLLYISERHAAMQARLAALTLTLTLTGGYATPGRQAETYYPSQGGGNPDPNLDPYPHLPRWGEFGPQS